ncbi:hypothetical protein BGZ82_010371 [Podila clonocystis]|nr:hypothetical protein BGZ82_010371 [Podila clonocystis]
MSTLECLHETKFLIKNQTTITLTIILQNSGIPPQVRQIGVTDTIHAIITYDLRIHIGETHHTLIPFHTTTTALQA